MRCRGAKSFVDDLVLSRGVVRSRAVHCCYLLRLTPLTRIFVRLRRTDLLLAAAACTGGAAGSLARVAGAGRPVGRTCDCSRCEPVSVLVVGGWGCGCYYYLVRVCLDAGRWWLCEAECVRARGVLSVLGMSLEAMPVNAGSNHDGVKVTK